VRDCQGLLLSALCGETVADDGATEAGEPGHARGGVVTILDAIHDPFLERPMDQSLNAWEDRGPSTRAISLFMETVFGKKYEAVVLDSMSLLLGEI